MLQGKVCNRSTLNSEQHIAIFISYFKNFDILNNYDIYEEYTSEIYGNVDVSLNLGVTTCQPHSNPQQAQFQTLEQPEQQLNEKDEQLNEQPEAQPNEQPQPAFHEAQSKPQSNEKPQADLQEAEEQTQT